MKDSNGNRWWEQYYVRYFVGTVIGVIVVFALRERAILAADFAKIVPAFNTIDAAKFTAVALVGLAYCYVASAPILTLHGVRGDWLHFADRDRFWKWVGVGYLFVIVILVVGSIIGSHDSSSANRIIWTGRLILVFFVITQSVLVGRTLLNRYLRLTRFYVELANQRSEKINAGGYIDSYRHLREHGNAVMIVVSEICLGLILSAATSLTQIVCFILLWTLPATAMWFVGTHLENNLSRGNHGLHPQCKAKSNR